MSPVIRLEGVRKAYRGIALFNEVELAIAPGRTYALRGANGSGKSVLLRLFCRMALPDAGTVTLDPTFLDRRRVFPDRFGVTIDGPAYLAHRSGFDNLLELAAIRRRTTPDAIASLLESFGLDPANPTPVRRYSTGMKQKLALSQAFMEDPEVLLLDEPFNGLDAKSVTELGERLHRFGAGGGTIVLTSHETAHLDALADHNIHIEEQRVLLD